MAELGGLVGVSRRRAQLRGRLAVRHLIKLRRRIALR
jgi:hypothetical protein